MKLYFELLPYLCVVAILIGFVARLKFKIEEDYLIDELVSFLTVPASLLYLFTFISLISAANAGNSSSWGAGLYYFFFQLISTVFSPVVFGILAHAGWTFGRFCRKWTGK
jgi:hypothetical protein